MKFKVLRKKDRKQSVIFKCFSNTCLQYCCLPIVPISSGKKFFKYLSIISSLHKMTDISLIGFDFHNEGFFHISLLRQDIYENTYFHNTNYPLFWTYVNVIVKNRNYKECLYQSLSEVDPTWFHFLKSCITIKWKISKQQSSSIIK